MTLKRLAITSGEPAGIGPDLCVQLSRQSFDAELIIIADPAIIQQRAQQLGVTVALNSYDAASSPRQHTAGTLTILPANVHRPVVCGQLDKHNADYVLNTLRLAIDGCLAKKFDAMITAPVHKGIINEAGYPFTGHTEFLAERSNTEHVVMMLATKGLRVALVTTHLPLRAVCDAITATNVERTLRITHQRLQQQFSCPSPRIVVCGLNPHAGEDGHLGREEIDIIIPVINKLKKEGLQLIGPLPADTAFIPKYMKDADVFVAMYHDQGLPVLKHMGFGNAINVTLGLPFIRTSVDHGTALELAGTNKANSNSMVYAINTALEMINNQATNQS